MYTNAGDVVFVMSSFFLFMAMGYDKRRLAKRTSAVGFLLSCGLEKWGGGI
jgi:hypothetical protein